MKYTKVKNKMNELKTDSRTVNHDIPLLLENIVEITGWDLSKLGNVTVKHVDRCNEEERKQLAICSLARGFGKFFEVNINFPYTIYTRLQDPHSRNYYTERKRLETIKEFHRDLIHELIHVIDLNIHGLGKLVLKLNQTYDSLFDNTRTCSSSERSEIENALSSLGYVAESHATYIETLWGDKNFSEGDYDFEELEEEYRIGIPLIDETYKRRLPITLLYDCLPKIENFHEPEAYFKRTDVKKVMEI